MSLSEGLGAFFYGKRIAITGHTGFKGSWLSLWAHKMGAEVLGLALPAESPLSAFNAVDLASVVKSEIVDIREPKAVLDSLRRFEPEIVFHLAAQAIVGTSYEDPTATFHTNVMGTVHVLDAIRACPSVKCAVLIATDKCYENVEQLWGYREIDPLGGKDPYSASKAAAEIATRAYMVSYFEKDGTAHIASARAGNVVGGGDWSDLRLVPDCIRSLRKGEPIKIRNPRSTRPWQFVLDPLHGYLMLARALWERGKTVSGAWNFGPTPDNTHDVERGARAVIDAWGGGSLELTPNVLFHEHQLLQLDCTKARALLGWRPALDFQETIAMTTAWYRHQHDTRDGAMRAFSIEQIEKFEAGAAPRTA